MAMKTGTKIVIGLIVAVGVAVLIYFLVVASQNHTQNPAVPMTAMGNNGQMMTPNGPIPILNESTQVTINQLTPAQRTRVKDPAALIYYQNQLAQAEQNISQFGLSADAVKFIGIQFDYDPESMALLPVCTQDPTTGNITCQDQPQDDQNPNPDATSYNGNSQITGL